jgi:hypothetical protein
MVLTVVRCPACRGACRVADDAVGYTVGCPRCAAAFLAVEILPPRTERTAEPALRADAVVPIAPPRQFPARPGADHVPVAEAAPGGHDPEHDPHARSVTGLPVSMLIGMALVPFGIPLLWYAVPFVTGRAAAVSLAVPIALAVAAATLCMGVVYTIDWTGTTRIKGVLVLVALSYLSAAGLYFLNKDALDRVRRLGGDPNEWTPVALDEGRCHVRLPGRAVADRRQPLDGLARMTDGRRARYLVDRPDGPRYEYRIAVGKPTGGKADAAWFDRVGERLKADGAELVGAARPLADGEPDSTGRQWTLKLDPTNTRVVRVFAIRDRVYLLSAEGPHLTPDDPEYARPFFNSFHVPEDK